MTSSKQHKLIVNTPTRTGSTFLCNSITNFLDIDDSLIYKTHDPVLLKKSLDMQIMILRNPVDSIASMVAMDKRNGSNNIDVDISDRISHFNEMLDAFCISYNKTVPFLFEQVINNTKEVVDIISKEFSINYRSVPLNNAVTDRHNFVKTSKTLDFYDHIFNKLGEHGDELSSLDTKYNRSVMHLHFRQKQLKFII